MKIVIVILGACYARTLAVASLCKQVGIKVLLIDKNPYHHQLVQQIYYVASGVKMPSEISAPLNFISYASTRAITGSKKDLINSRSLLSYGCLQHSSTLGH
jgi:NADH dehydrogenase FAD-containing subunit